MTSTTIQAAARLVPAATMTVITPETAARWLGEHNTNNRPIRKVSVDNIARDIAEGRWEVNGESIKIDIEGRILDGQHRLAACVKAGRPITSLVVRNLPAHAQATIDTGRARTASDALSIGGRRNTTTLAAAARLALQVELDDVDNRNFSPTHGEIEAFIDANPLIEYAAEFASGVARRTDCPPSVVAYTAFALAKIDINDAFDFWTSCAEKVGLSVGDPVIALSNRFAEARRNKERLSKRAYLSAIYRAWNYRREGKPLRIIKINSAAGGLIPIPEPR